MDKDDKKYRPLTKTQSIQELFRLKIIDERGMEAMQKMDDITFAHILQHILFNAAYLGGTIFYPISRLRNLYRQYKDRENKNGLR